MYSVVEFLITVVVLICSVYFAYSQYTYKWYWKRRQIPFVPAKFPLGNLHNIKSNESFFKFIQRNYNRFKTISLYFGIYFYCKPAVVITDWPLAKMILVDKFAKFNDRSLYHNERDDPLSGQLVHLSWNKARKIRAEITPAFTPIRMKDMFTNIVGVSNRLSEYMEATLKKNKEFDIEDLLARYTIDVIGSAAFGLECNSLENPENEFRKMCEIGIAKPRHSSLIKFLLNYNQPLARFLRIKLIPNDISEFFLKLVQDAMNERESKNIRKMDFLDLLIDVKENSNNNLSINELAAQAYAFFTPGFETISVALTCMLYELAKNPNIQAKARSEIKTVFGIAHNDSCLTYENVSKMTYLNNIISETLRKYPPFTMLRRIAVDDFQIPGTSQVIERGTPVIIPVYSFHHDPEFFPNPDEFQPDRFSSNESNRTRTLAFGLGQRKCIGMRFSEMLLSITLITIVKNFEIFTCDQTITSIKFKPSFIRLSPKDRIYLRFNSLSNDDDANISTE